MLESNFFSLEGKWFIELLFLNSSNKKISFVVVLLVCLETGIAESLKYAQWWRFYEGNCSPATSIAVLLPNGISLRLAYFLSKLNLKDNFIKHEGCKWPWRMSRLEMFSVSTFHFHYPICYFLTLSSFNMCCVYHHLRFFFCFNLLF